MRPAASSRCSPAMWPCARATPARPRSSSQWLTCRRVWEGSGWGSKATHRWSTAKAYGAQQQHLAPSQASQGASLQCQRTRVAIMAAWQHGNEASAAIVAIMAAWQQEGEVLAAIAAIAERVAAKRRGLGSHCGHHGSVAARRCGSMEVRPGQLLWPSWQRGSTEVRPPALSCTSHVAHAVYGCWRRPDQAWGDLNLSLRW